MGLQIESLIPSNNHLGEGPIWDEQSQTLFGWTVQVIVSESLQSGGWSTPARKLAAGIWIKKLVL